MLILILRSQQEMEANVKGRRETIVKVKTKSTGRIAYLRVLRLLLSECISKFMG